jgi:hypothetical protein
LDAVIAAGRGGLPDGILVLGAVKEEKPLPPSSASKMITSFVLVGSVFLTPPHLLRIVGVASLLTGGVDIAVIDSVGLVDGDGFLLIVRPTPSPSSFQHFRKCSAKSELSFSSARRVDRSKYF